MTYLKKTFRACYDVIDGASGRVVGFVKNKTAQANALAITGLATAQSSMAASQLDATLMTTYMTDLTDTVAELKGWLIGGVFIIAGAMFAVNMTRKGTGKLGGR